MNLADIVKWDSTDLQIGWHALKYLSRGYTLKTLCLLIFRKIWHWTEMCFGCLQLWKLIDVLVWFVIWKYSSLKCKIAGTLKSVFRWIQVTAAAWNMFPCSVWSLLKLSFVFFLCVCLRLLFDVNHFKILLNLLQYCFFFSLMFVLFTRHVES